MGGEGRISGGISRISSFRHREMQVAQLARRRHRVVTREQLLALGLTAEQIRHRVATLRLVKVHPGVYAVGPGGLSTDGEWLAATDYGAPDGVLSHGAGAGLWSLRPWHGGVIDITAPRRIVAPQGLRAHRSRLPRDERTIRRGIPVTTTARTILDCAADLDVRSIERMLNEAHVLGLPLKPRPEVLLARYPHRRGIVAFRAALAAFSVEPSRTRSDLEERFVRFLDRHGFPRPMTNRDIETHIGVLNVDCVWPDERVVVELDAYSTHGTKRSMLRDRRRDRALLIAGYSPGRVMHEDLDHEGALVAEIAALLAVGDADPPRRRASQGPPR